MHSREKFEPKGLSDYLAVMSRSVFEPGLSRAVVEAKWSGTVEAFDGFDPERVASYTPGDVERLMADSRIVRNRRKIEAVVHNAGEMLDLDAADGFRVYLRSKDSYEELVADLKSRFKFLGDSGAYHFLHSVGEAVPSREDWMAAHADSGAAKKWRAR